MAFEYDYTIQFRDTDAAGVVYFASIISLCHVAYEASLIESDIDLKSFVSNPEFAVPITHVAADFLRPLYCGDRVSISLTPAEIDRGKFEIIYQILTLDAAATERQNLAATVTTKHVVIDPQTRKRQDLPRSLGEWLVRWR
ncbi:acyl-CoA thioesterase [Chamaesiphon sp. VAR_69_metabat_338]|uniref:acyl-CoA thioesterase n=1 Tax=Chamaesiphon sp. VAR_69_metabat_338 TaxID=2964704 RepID=UPI0037C00A4B